jgi:hypothetical protein
LLSQIHDGRANISRRISTNLEIAVRFGEPTFRWRSKALQFIVQRALGDSQFVNIFMIALFLTESYGPGHDKGTMIIANYIVRIRLPRLENFAVRLRVQSDRRREVKK